METKIIATIGPASENSAILNQILKAGMNIARINTKYGSLEQWQKI
ncbi:MAG: pyruvate kinase, partial [Candidatus Woesearchaeota archaeon]